MNNQEALEILKATIKVYEYMATDSAGQEFVEAFKMSVEALENQTSVIVELENIKAEIEKDKKLYSYNEHIQKGHSNCIDIVNSHISELKGENNA